LVAAAYAGLTRGWSLDQGGNATPAEPGGLEGKGLWRPAAKGLRPRYENAAMQRYLAGGFVSKNEGKRG